MRLRHQSLFLLVAAMVAACGAKSSSNNQKIEKTVSLHYQKENKELLQARLKNSKNPLEQLVRLRALFDLKRYEEVTEAPPIKDERFAPYSEYLRILSHRELENYESVIQSELPDDLPVQLRQRLFLARAESYERNNQPTEALHTYQDFTKEFRRGPLLSEVLYRMADLELKTGNRQRALELFEKVYRDHPLSDTDGQARQQLDEAGRLSEMDTEYHFNRIARFQSAARFSLAESELNKLKKFLKPEAQPRIALALARLDMAQKRYQKVMKTATQQRKSVKGTNFELEWQQLGALAATRAGDFEAAIKDYEALLKQSLSRSLRETILLRLGFIYLDDEKFSEAAKSFERLRQDFKRGRFVESAHWFGAWALLMTQLERRSKGQELERERLHEANELLKRLVTLPEGKLLEPTAIYWQMKIAAWLRDRESEDLIRQSLQKRYAFSFPSLFLQPKVFSFLNSHDLKQDPAPQAAFSFPQKYDRLLSWQRLEAFQRVQLDNWAKYELNRFIEEIDVLHPSTAELIAERFEGLQDWDDLVRFSENYLKLELEHLDPRERRVRFHYPRAYEDAVVRYSAKYNVSPFLVWGLMRQESRFDSDAISAAGAVGLMQIMPRLWTRISRALPTGAANTVNMTDPDKNIRVGTYHLAELRQQIADFPVPDELKPALEIAAYNAGVEAVQRWVGELDTRDVDVFIENIPFAETRTYVKRVLQNAWIYSELYGEKPKEVSINRRSAFL